MYTTLNFFPDAFEKYQAKRKAQKILDGIRNNFWTLQDKIDGKPVGDYAGFADYEDPSHPNVLLSFRLWNDVDGIYGGDRQTRPIGIRKGTEEQAREFYKALGVLPEDLDSKLSESGGIGAHMLLNPDNSYAINRNGTITPQEVSDYVNNNTILMNTTGEDNVRKAKEDMNRINSSLGYIFDLDSAYDTPAAKPESEWADPSIPEFYSYQEVVDIYNNSIIDVWHEVEIEITPSSRTNFYSTPIEPMSTENIDICVGFLPGVAVQAGFGAGLLQEGLAIKIEDQIKDVEGIKSITSSSTGSGFFPTLDEKVNGLKSVTRFEVTFPDSPPCIADCPASSQSTPLK